LPPGVAFKSSDRRAVALVDTVKSTHRINAIRQGNHCERFERSVQISHKLPRVRCETVPFNRCETLLLVVASPDCVQVLAGWVAHKSEFFALLDHVRESPDRVFVFTGLSQLVYCLLMDLARHSSSYHE
jgi:hypothetical protein